MSGSGLGAERERETIRTPASLSMLPLTDVDYYAVSDGGGYESGARSRSGSGRSGGGGGGGGGGSGGKEVGAGGGAGEPWHNPNLMQMAEMLSSVMGRMGAGERLDPT
jgi:hypothetical protein